MPYFKLLVITFCLVVSQFCHSKDNDIDKLLLSVNDQKIFNLALKEGNKGKWARTLKNVNKLDNSAAKKNYTLEMVIF